jgi:hypothetical protein
MLDDVRAHLDRGDPAGARTSLADALKEFAAEEFSRGALGHPLLGSRSAKLRTELHALAVGLADQPDRVRGALERVEVSIRKKTVDAATLDRLNFALQVLLPDVALLLDEALENARFKLGAASSNVEDPMAGALRNPFVSGEVAALVTLAEEAGSLFEGNRLERLQKVTLATLDAPEPDHPVITQIFDDELWIECPACGNELRTPVTSFGQDVRCDCKRSLTVPRPSLERMAMYLKEQRDTARGIARCKVCCAVIQVGRDGYMRAGFCTSLCASQAREIFKEHVAREGTREGDEVRFQCFCGATITAPLADMGGKVACLSCPLEVWIPAPAAVSEPASRRPGPLTCSKCGKPVKPTAKKCMYCGTPPSA